MHRVRLDGTGDSALFTDTWSIDAPSVSPDGTTITYGRSKMDGVTPSEVWTARIDGSGRTKVAEGDWPAWSPDGSRLAFIAPAGKADDGLPLVQVFAVAAGGGTPVAVTDSEQDERRPVIWFGGDRIAYLYGSATGDYCQLFAVQAPAA